MLKELLISLTFLFAYSTQAIDEMKAELNLPKLEFCRNKQKQLMAQYKEITQRYYDHISGQKKIYRTSHASPYLRKDYTDEEAKEETESQLNEVLKNIIKCSSCFTVLEEFKAFHAIVAENIKEL